MHLIDRERIRPHGHLPTPRRIIQLEFRARGLTADDWPLPMLLLRKAVRLSPPVDVLAYKLFFVFHLDLIRQKLCDEPAVCLFLQVAYARLYHKLFGVFDFYFFVFNGWIWARYNYYLVRFELLLIYRALLFLLLLLDERVEYERIHQLCQVYGGVTVFTESLLDKDRPAQGVDLLRFIAIHEAVLCQAPEYEGITDVVHQVDPEALVSALEAVATTEDRRPFRDEERCVDRAIPDAWLS